ncbi:MAG: J domain-containing protein [Magnetococcus sp. WYHC-3]
MTAGFWDQFDQHSQRRQALAVLGLREAANPAEIRRRYRDLLRTHHPDRGGDPAEFRRITEAAATLLEAPRW